MSELYELPDGWEWKKLEDIFLIQRGGSPRPIKDYITDAEDGINWIKIGDTKKGEKYITQTAQKIKPEGLKKSRLVVEGDFLMSNSMSFGRPYIVKTKGAIHDGWLLMREKLDNTDKDFFYYLLSSNYMYQQFASKASGTTVKNLNINLVKSTDIPLPPLKEQNRIVSKLDNLFEKIDKSIALHVENIDNADLFMGSVLNDVFRELEGKYEKTKLFKIVKVIGGGTPSKKEKSYWDNGTIKWATVGDMNVEIIQNTALSITEKGLKESSSNIIPKEAIVIATRVGLGKVCYLENNTAINQDLKGLLPLSHELNIRFLFNYFMNIQKYIISNGTGATVKGVKLDFIKELLLPFPPLKTQQKTVAYLDKISLHVEQLKQVQKEKMQSLVALKASILDRAFRGEL